ncbi:MAG: UDP-N-acetylglucosamine 1-carboxyvinyltransferase [Anaerolineales bacterium]|uniref:UDP-N-acetylglucosamine 1-carboxyvinyltransferase n=1 Tax=Promineifilum sp. TaxID=2664178 RepID=UPI001DBFE073|nr:UDP-N-acetylglucosamine 1-carboxyvinyltransferase [Anaerolineales bacterium]MCB8935728.1 UDP-N-acetylglucosamine 1-carboxyvinyltransferase [Promineifilum sp.]MCO5179530.1 UDP-N-acetylglucosamine 1-carboxyvinyltransferase [Promineifilum sp.]
MSKFIIEGGQALCGEVTVSGNKNAALKLLPACLLTDEPVILHNIPAIRDVQNTMLVLRDLGVDVVELGGGSWRIHARNVDKAELDPELAARTRASFVFAGPMLARVGRVVLPIPGGDVIGGRPLDTHVQALTALGASVSMSQRGVFEMAAPRLRGAGHLLLAEASVTATENAVMAAVLAKGDTIIDNAACEPHVRDLCDFLNSMGGQIEGIGSNRLTIRGVDKLHGTEFRIGSDFMEVGSFIGAAAVTGGEVRIRDAQPRNLGMIRLVYKRFGVRWEDDGEDIIVPGNQEMMIHEGLGGRIPEIKPLPWPGFPPDLMSIAVVLGTQAAGSILLHDWMYESRFFFVDHLTFMGARVVLCDPHRVLVQGPCKLFANPAGVPSPDIRAGMAMVLAALCARGTSTIHNIQQIDRGYEQIENKLRGLGASIVREAD